MIIDKLENLMRYAALNPLIADVEKFLRQHDMQTIANGHHTIIDNRLYVNVEDDAGKQPEEAVVEFHRRMIDVQIPLNIPETYGYVPVCDLPEVTFDEEKDIAKLPGVKPHIFLTLQPGEFAVFFPQDGHAPCIADGLLHKAVFKLAVEGYKQKK